MTLGEQMKLWEERENDEFGIVLKQLKEATKDSLSTWTEMGIEYNSISPYITSYSLDGNRKWTANHLKTVLENYDIIDNDENVKKLVNKLFELC